MLKNYLRVAFRHLRANLGITALTVFALALGMAVCLLILTFVWAQKSTDRFHANGDRIVRVLTERDDGGLLAATPAPLADVLAREVPGIEATVRLGELSARVLRDGGAVDLSGLYAEPSFFDVFSFAGQGDVASVLAEPYRVLLTAEAAATVFGTADPVGQSLTLDGLGDFVVGGVLAEAPGPSHLQFDVLASFATLAASDRRADLADWTNTWNFATYLLLDDPETARRVTAALPAIAKQNYAGDERPPAFRVQPLWDIALGPAMGNEISSFSIPAVVVALLSALGLVVMLTAGFNYVGLSTARSLRRAGEVGMRKTLGAGRRQIAAQFLTESVIVSLGALGLAYLLLLWLTPAFNGLAPVQMLGAEIDPAHLLDPRLLGLFVVFSVGIGAVAGLYPAVVVARFSPLMALKSQHVDGFSGRRLRHGLIGAQFALALFFVLTTALLVAQARQLLHADYGFERSDLIALNLQGQDIEVLRSELGAYPEIEGVAGTSILPASGSTSTAALNREGREPIQTYEYVVEGDALGVLGVDLVAGRALFGGAVSDSTQAVVLNETAVRTLGFESPLDATGALLTMNDRAVEVVGVVKDYHHEVLIHSIGPMVLREAPSQIRHALVRSGPGRGDAALDRVRAVWNTLDPERPVEATLLDRQLADNYVSVMVDVSVQMIGTVAAFAVLISLLGLLGMAAYHVETRVKEVGVRKVLGATLGDVVVLLSGTFARIVAVGTAVAVPVAWIASDRWLQVFAVRTEPSLWLMAAGALAMAGLALGVVASQAVRAALADPVRTLRSE